MLDRYKYEDFEKEPEIQDVNFVIVEDSSSKEETKTNSAKPEENTKGSEVKSDNSFQYRNDFQDVNPNGKSVRKKNKFGKNAKIALFLILFLMSNVLAGSAGALIALNSQNHSIDNFGKKTDNMVANSDSSAFETTSSSNSKRVGGTKLTTSEVVSMNENSVVEIKTEGTATDTWLRQYVTRAGGSGVIVSQDGYIVTNNHVIDGANKISVRLKNGKVYDAKLVGHDDDTDLAVIKINASGLTPVVYGSSKVTQVGEQAIVIGNPLGNLGGTVTVGIISALDRQLDIEGKPMRLLQTDASVNPGNSGGGMFNDRGELIGIVVAKSAGTNVEGLGFAIPVDKVKTIAKQLASYGYVRGKVSTGMTYVDLTSMKDALVYGATNLGIYIQSVDSKLAKEAGFKSGDMVYYVDKTQIKSFDDLTGCLEGKKVGDKLEVRVVRDDKILKLTLTLGEKNNS